jgi:hypothetical protein
VIVFKIKELLQIYPAKNKVFWGISRYVWVFLSCIIHSSIRFAVLKYINKISVINQRRILTEAILTNLICIV